MWNMQVLRLVSRYQLVVVALGVALGLWLKPSQTLGFVLGGSFAFVNFWGLRFLVQRTFTVFGRRKILYGILLAFKMALALALMTLLLLVFKVEPLAFALGLATFFLGVVLALSHVIILQRTPTA